MQEILSFLAEIGQTETCRRLVFTFFTERDNNQHDYCDDVGEHLEYFLRGACEPGDVEEEPEESAEKIGAPDGLSRFPAGKDYERYGKPAELFDSAVGGPGALYVVHDVVKTAKTGNRGADAG